MKILKKLAPSAVFAATLALSGVANATLIQYNFNETDPNNSDFSLTAQIEIDVDDIIVGKDLSVVFDSWFLSWTDGTNSYDVSSGAGDLLSPTSDFFVSDTLGTFGYMALCSLDCSFTNQVQSLLYQVDAGVVAIVIRDVPTDSGGYVRTGFINRENPFPTSTVLVSTVPEPTALALFASGLFAFGVQRRVSKMKG